MREKIILAWSGGKDSIMALYKLQTAYRYDVTALLSEMNSASNRATSHNISHDLLLNQAQALELPLHTVDLPAVPTNEQYESSMEAALLSLRGPGMNDVAYGDLYLEDVRAYRENLLAKLGLKGIFPLWGRDSEGLAEEFIALGFQAIVVCVDKMRLDESFVGREFDHNFLRDLPPEVDRCGENGEFHTFVYNGPNLTQSVPFELGELYQLDERFVYCDLLPADQSAEADA